VAGFGVVFWLADRWIESVFCIGESLLKTLQPNGMEFFLRFLVVVQMILLGYLASRAIAANNCFTANTKSWRFSR
jgi:hypothetical protein